METNSSLHYTKWTAIKNNGEFTTLPCRKLLPKPLHFPTTFRTRNITAEE